MSLPPSIHYAQDNVSLLQIQIDPRGLPPPDPNQLHSLFFTSSRFTLNIAFSTLKTKPSFLNIFRSFLHQHSFFPSPSKLQNPCMLSIAIPNFKINFVHQPFSGSIFSLTLLPSKSMLISKLQDVCYNPFPLQNTCCSSPLYLFKIPADNAIFLQIPCYPITSSITKIQAVQPYSSPDSWCPAMHQYH